MRVSQCLRMLSEATIKAIATEQNQRLAEASELDLETRSTNAGFLADVWNQLTDLEHSVIRLFLLEAPRGFLSKKQWDRLSRQEHVHLSHGLTRVRRLGLIYTVRKLWSEVGYVLPLELREHFSAFFHSESLANKNTSVHKGNQTLSYYIPSGRGIHLDVFALLLFVRDHEVPITQKRAIHRRFLQKVTAALSVTEAHVSNFSRKFGQEQEKPEAAIVIDLAMRLHLVRADQNKLRLVQPAVDNWLALAGAERWERLFTLICEQYLPHETWCEAFLFLMKQQPSEQWGGVDSLVKQLRQIGYQVPDNAVEEITARWLHLLLGFGLIQLGTGENDDLFWRWNPLARKPAVDGWYVEPTGDVVIPPLVPLQRIWEISRLGRLSFEGELLRCVLEAEKVKRIVGQGGTEEQIIELLQKSCFHPLPEAVVTLIRLWANATRQIRFERVVRVKTTQPSFLQEIRDISAFQPYLQEIISDTDFLISSEQEKALYDLLRQYGYEPQLWQKENSAKKIADENVDAKDAAGLFMIELPWEGYQVENIFPERYESLPEMSKLPKMWTEHYQAYHPQTLRDLFKRALELQMEVRVEHDNGGEWQGIPRSVEAQMGYWYITLESERKKQRYKLEEIRRVRIMLPDYL